MAQQDRTGEQEAYVEAVLLLFMTLVFGNAIRCRGLGICTPVSSDAGAGSLTTVKGRRRRLHHRRSGTLNLLSSRVGR